MEIRLSKEQQLEFLIRDTLTRTLREHMQAPEVMRIDTPREKVEMPQLFEVPAESVKDQVREDSVEAKEWRRQAEVMNEQRQRESIAASLSREISQPQPLTAGKDKEEILPEDLKGEVMAKLPDFSAGSPVKKNTASVTETLSDQEPVSEPLDPRVSQTEATEETL